jgi:hypothetical protein
MIMDVGFDIFIQQFGEEMELKYKQGATQNRRDYL